MSSDSPLGSWGQGFGPAAGLPPGQVAAMPIYGVGLRPAICFSDQPDVVTIEQMEARLRQTKRKLPKLAQAVIEGAAPAVATPPASSGQGRGYLRDRIHLYTGWDSPAEDRLIENAFELINDISPK